MQNIEMNQTNLNNLIKSLYENTDTKSDEYKILGDYLNLQKKRFADEQNDTSRPFLTVITRTQGRRPEMLTETFLCLAGQSNLDFEYIVAGHNLNEAETKTVTDLIAEMPLWMQAKTRFLPVNGGTRTTPLIKGFEAAKGKYIAVLDDDDIVFDNWVEAFYEAYKKAPGKILHSYVVFQDWETVSDTLPDTPIAVGKPSNVFCKDFVMLTELTKNVCPLMSVAFPSYIFNTFKINFDEELTTTEDWDFLMRNAFICGVENNPTVTSVYRNWKNAENSQTIHGKKEWKQNYEKIVERFKKTPMIFDEQGISEYIDKTSTGGRNHVSAGSVELFFDNGHGFNAGDVMRAVPSADDGFVGEFSDLEELGEILAVRLDPAAKGNILAGDLTVKIVFGDGSEKLYGISDFTSNAVIMDGFLIFLKDDPQLVLNFASPQKINKILFTFTVQKPVPDKYIDILIYKSKPFVIRALKKLKNIVTGR